MSVLAHLEPRSACGRFDGEVPEQPDNGRYVHAYSHALLSMATNTGCCRRGADNESYFFGAGGAHAAGRLWDEPAVTPFNPLLGEVENSRYAISSHASGFVLPDVHVVNPGEPSYSADVVVRGEHVHALKFVGTPRPADLPVLEEYRECWVMPGLIDMHAHLPGKNILDLTPHFMRMFLAHGVTGIRETGDVDGTALPEASAWIAKSESGGPRIAASYYFIGRPPFRWKNCLEYRNEGDVEEIFARLRKAGAQCIKLYENLRENDLRVLQDAAAQHGISVLGHVPTALGLEEARLRDSQHFFGVPPPDTLARDHVLARTARWDAVNDQRIQVIVDACRRFGLANTPTLVVNSNLLLYKDHTKACDRLQSLMPDFFGSAIWHPSLGLPAYRNLHESDFSSLEAALRKKQRLVHALHQAGCALHLGTDTMQPFCTPGRGLWDELELFVDAGISTTAALRMATIEAARYLGWNDAGYIAAGKKADLLILRADPRHDLSALRTLELVVSAGKAHNVGELRSTIQDDLDDRNRLFKKIATHVIARIAMWQAARKFVG